MSLPSLISGAPQTEHDVGTVNTPAQGCEGPISGAPQVAAPPIEKRAGHTGGGDEHAPRRAAVSEGAEAQRGAPGHTGAQRHADAWTWTAARLIGEPLPALPAGRGRRVRPLTDSDADPAAEAFDTLQPMRTDMQTVTRDNAHAQRHLATGADLLESLMAGIRRDDPTAAREVLDMLRAGAMARLSVTVAPATGQALVLGELLLPNGEPVQLGRIELQRAVRQ